MIKRIYENIRSLKSLLSFCNQNQAKKIIVTTKIKRRQVEENNLLIDFKKASLLCYEIGRSQILDSSLNQG